MNKDMKNLIIFFIATFLWTWAFYIPIALTGNSPYEMPWMILLIIGGAGPSIVGIAMVLLTYDRERRRDYWRRCFSPGRISPLWGLAILLIFPAIYAVSIVLETALGGPIPGMDQLKALIANPVTIPLAAFMSFLSGPISEEFGWRGFSLDAILRRFGPLAGSAGLGAIWGVWHLPLFYMPATWHGQMGFQLAGFWTFILFNVGLSMVMTWVFQNTGRSILSGILTHFTSNFTAQLLWPYSNRLEILHAILLLAVGVMVCLQLERKMRSREFSSAGGSLRSSVADAGLAEPKQ